MEEEQKEEEVVEEVSAVEEEALLELPFMRRYQLPWWYTCWSLT